MNDLPPVLVCITTYFPPGEMGARRAGIASKTFASWMRHLRYVGETRMHIADDGSAPEHYEGFIRAIARMMSPRDDLITVSTQTRHGVGASLNQGVLRANEIGAVLAYFVDDWYLNSDLDMTPWVRLLQRDELVGMVRVGMPHPWLTGTVHHLDGGWGLLLDRHHFAFGHRPALYHRRMFDAYGLFDDGVNAYECERLYNERFCAGEGRGPGILLALHSPFTHMGGVELADIDPRGIPDGP